MKVVYFDIIYRFSLLSRVGQRLVRRWQWSESVASQPEPRSLRFLLIRRLVLVLLITRLSSNLCRHRYTISSRATHDYNTWIIRLINCGWTMNFVTHLEKIKTNLEILLANSSIWSIKFIQQFKAHIQLSKNKATHPVVVILARLNTLQRDSAGHRSTSYLVWAQFTLVADIAPTDSQQQRAVIYVATVSGTNNEVFTGRLTLCTYI